MSNDELEKKEKEDDYDYYKLLGLAALVGGGIILYKMLTSAKGQTFIGGGLAATGAKIIKDNWNK